MENRRGNGIFLGVVSVSTLVVAIIGATFAYFSASTSSANDAVNLTAYEFNASLSVNRVYPEEATAIIPVEPGKTIENAPEGNNTNLLYALNVAEDRCIDDSGLQVCALYEVTITNNGTQPLTLGGQIRTVTNNKSTRTGATPFTNLTYQAVKGTLGALELDGNPTQMNLDVDGLTTISTVTVNGATTTEGGETTPGTATTYVLVYLNENGDQSAEMGASYTGQLIYTTTTGNGNQLTGTFTVSAGE